MKKPYRFVFVTVALYAALSGIGVHAQGVSKTTVLVGQSGPLTGANKEFGEDVRDGVLAYFKKVNEAGGINGRKFELITLDDANDAKRAGENAGVLIEQKGVIALIGYASATLSRPALPIVEKNKVAFVGPLTGAEPMRKFNRYVYNVRASYADELEKIVDYYTATGIKRFAVLHYDDAVGKENLGAVEIALTKRGLKPVAAGAVTRNQTDLSKAIAAVRDSKPEVVITTTLYRTTADFIKQGKKIGLTAQYASTSFVGASALANELGPEGIGVVVAQVVPPYAQLSNSIVREYRAAIEKLLGKKEYSFTSLEAYINAKVLVEGVKRAGANLTRESLLKALDSIKATDFGGYFIDFSDTNHNGSQYVELTAITKSGFSY